MTFEYFCFDDDGFFFFLKATWCDCDSPAMEGLDRTCSVT